MAFGCDPFPPSQFPPSQLSITLTGLTSGGPVSPDANGNISLGGSNVAVVGDPLTNTLTFTAPGASGITWIVNTAPTVQMAVNTGYIDNFTGSTIYTLPLTSAVGDILYIVSGLDSGSSLVWEIFLNAGQQIVIGNDVTDPGPTNPVAVPDPAPAVLGQNGGAGIYLVCSVANLRWATISIFGSVQITPVPP